MLSTRTSEATDWLEMAQVRAWLGVVGTELDALLQPLLSASLEMAEGHLGRPACPHSYVERRGPFLLEAAASPTLVELTDTDLPAIVSASVTVAGAPAALAARLLRYDDGERRASVELGGALPIDLDAGSYLTLEWSVRPPADDREMITTARLITVASLFEGREGQGGGLPAAARNLLDASSMRRFYV